MLLGNICLGNPKTTEMVRFGLQGPVVLKRLCSLPFEYFNDAVLRLVLLPTLVILTSQDESNRLIMGDDVSVDFLAAFLNQMKVGACESKKQVNGRHTSQGDMALGLNTGLERWMKPHLRLSKECIEHSLSVLTQT